MSTEKLTWERLADGSWLCKQYPIRLWRTGRDVPVQVEVPLERDENFDDGWQWTRVDDRPSLWNIPGAKAWVAENVEHVRKFGTEDTYDGDQRKAAEVRQVKHKEWLRSVRAAQSGMATERRGVSIRTRLAAEIEAMLQKVDAELADRPVNKMRAIILYNQRDTLRWVLRHQDTDIGREGQ